MINYEKIKQENAMLKQKQNDENEKENNDKNDENDDIIIQEINIENNNTINEKIDIDIDKLKNILFNRLKTYHEKHIDELINEYDLHNKTEIDKTIMEKLLLKAIHI